MDFAAIGGASFLDGVREVVGIEKPAAPEPEAEARAAEPNTGLLEANVRMLEVLAAWDADVPWPPALRDRAGAALRKLLERIEGD